MGLCEEDVLQAILDQRSRLLAYIWAIVRDQSVVEDVFQEVSLLALRKRGEISCLDKLPSWLRETARFKALSALRDRGREMRALSEAALLQLDRVAEESDVSGHEAYLAALQHCLELLPAHSKNIIALRYLHGLKAPEVAQRLERDVNSVYVSISRIYGRLRECIQRQLSGVEGEHA